MSTVVIPRERHEGEKTACQGREKEEKPLLLVCDSSQNMDLSAFWIKVGRWAGDVRGCRVRRESHRAAGSFSQGNEQDWPCRQPGEDKQAAATLL